MSMIKNLILDVDGTLWDTTHVVAKAWNKAIEEDGNSKIRVTAQSLKMQFGKPMNVIADNLFTDVNEKNRQKLLEACCTEEQRALDKTMEQLQYPDVTKTISYLKEKKGYRLYIVSNCQTGYIELVIRKNRLENMIEDYECFGHTNKTKGENISLICERNHLRKEETLYIGDTTGDYEAAKSAGISFVFASYGFGKVPEAEIVVKEFSELPKLLNEIGITEDEI